jgi:multiple sugar transport system permease protein
MFTHQAAGANININEGVEMAGTLLTILPLLVIYFVLQRWFVESVDRSGITGE